jgi:ATP-binding cassette subfamily B protein
MNQRNDMSEASAAGAAQPEGHPGIIWCLTWLSRFGRNYTWQIGLVLGAVLVESCFIGALPLSFKCLVDQPAPGRHEQALGSIFWALALGVTAASLAGLGRNYLYGKVVAGIVSDLRDRMFCHLQNLSLTYFQQTRPGDTITRFSADLSTIENSLTTVMPLVVTPGIDLMVSVVLLFWVDWRLALVAMLIWPLALLGPRCVMPGALRATSRKLELESHTLQWVQENLAGQTVIKAFDLRSRMIGIFRARNQALRAGICHLNQTSGLVEKTSVIGIWMLQVVVLAAGACLTQRGSLTIGALGAFQALFMTLANSLYYVSQYAPTLIQAGGAMQHIEGLLSEPPPLTEQPAARELSRLRRGIAFEDVSFSYTGERPGLDQVNLEIPRGSTAAFVGPSGSGKSTMAHLLARLYYPDDGRVVVDGHDLSRIDGSSWRKQIGLVTQESYLFSTSIRENIRYGNPSAQDEEVIEAAKAAGIHDVITRLPQGYDTVLGGSGINLSGGQRQRIAIARALVADPAVLILDEATSALDPATEARVNRSLLANSVERTVVAVTHRLASLMHFDQICVFDKGRLVERGCHLSLLARRGIYYHLWREQNGVSADVQNLPWPSRPESTAAHRREVVPTQNRNSAMRLPRHSKTGVPLCSGSERDTRKNSVALA